MWGVDFDRSLSFLGSGLFNQDTIRNCKEAPVVIAQREDKKIVKHDLREWQDFEDESQRFSAEEQKIQSDSCRVGESILTMVIGDW